MHLDLFFNASGVSQNYVPAPRLLLVIHPFPRILISFTFSLSPFFPTHTVTHSYRAPSPHPLPRTESRIVTHLLPALDLRRIRLMPVTASACDEKGKKREKEREGIFHLKREPMTGSFNKPSYDLSFPPDARHFLLSSSRYITQLSSFQVIAKKRRDLQVQNRHPTTGTCHRDTRWAAVRRRDGRAFCLTFLRHSSSESSEQTYLKLSWSGWEGRLWLVMSEGWPFEGCNGDGYILNIWYSLN